MASYHCNSVSYIGLKHFCVSLFDCFRENQSFFGKRCFRPTMPAKSSWNNRYPVATYLYFLPHCNFLSRQPPFPPQTMLRRRMNMFQDMWCTSPTHFSICIYFIIILQHCIGGEGRECIDKSSMVFQHFWLAL